MNLSQKIKIKLINSKILARLFYKYNFEYRKKDLLCNLVFDKICSEKLIFPKTEVPKVSIVISVYNQFSFTFACLHSILKNTQNIDYELIIADDKSSDETVDILNRVENIRVIKPEKNSGYLRNTNNACEYAKGKYILLLNNDMLVKPDWLKPLIDVFEKDEQTGAAGGKILNADGTIQQAGSKLNPDGSPTWLGSAQSADLSEFNKQYNVDYHSGCCLMFRKSHWDKLGGFDTQFAPAYYEDTDFCMQIKHNLNLNVVYVPECEIIHFNNVTYSENAEKQSLINREKFLKKWGSYIKNNEYSKDAHKKSKKKLFSIKKETFGDAWEVTLTLFGIKTKRKYSTVKFDEDKNKNILVIDWRIPTYDQDAGSKTTWHYLYFFKKIGKNPVLYPDDRTLRHGYLEQLQNDGISVILEKAKAHLKKHGKKYGYVYLNRPDLAQKYLKIIKKYTNAKILYYGHDLHYLREQRRYEIEKKPEAKESSEKYKKIESEIIRNVSTVLMCSNRETQELKKINPNIESDCIPPYIYDVSQKESIIYKADERKDILFIGGFAHNPNVDGIKWFVNEIFPKVKQQIQGIKFYLVGSAPTEEILALKSDDIIVTGFVTDEELEKIYKNIKLSVVPLRFGAGIKGKIIEAVYNKVPVVTTSIGVEGINNDDGLISVFDDADSFANGLINMYNNNEKLEEIASKSLDLIDKFYSENAVIEKFKQWMEV